MRAAGAPESLRAFGVRARDALWPRWRFLRGSLCSIGINTQSVEHLLRRDGGAWLKSLREQSGLTQRAFAITVGTDYYTFISQIENGRGRVPPDRYKLWAEVLKVDPKEFMQGLMRYYDPYGYEMLFGEFPQPRDVGNDNRDVA